MRPGKEELQHTIHFLCWKIEEHDPSTTWCCELRGHKWDMHCGKKRMTIMSGWKPPFVPALEIPEFNWITANPIETHGIPVIHAFLYVLKKPPCCSFSPFHSGCFCKCFPMTIVKSVSWDWDHYCLPPCAFWANKKNREIDSAVFMCLSMVRSHSRLHSPEPTVSSPARPREIIMGGCRKS